MHSPTTRLSHVQQYGGHDELVAIVQRVLPRIGNRAEDTAMWLLLGAFWGLILVLTMTAL